MTSVGVIAHARKRLGDGLPALREALARHGINDARWEEVPKSKYVRDRVRSLVDEGVDLLFTWGGDGTVQHTIDAVAGEPVTLAIVPAGTANLFATNLGLPQDIEECVRIGLHGERRTLDVGVMNGEHFSVMGGIGLDAMMIKDADAGLKDKVGRIAYVWTGAKNVALDSVKTRIEVDGAPWFEGKASCVLVGNVSDVLGGLSVFPQALPDDGRLDIGVVTADGAWEWARTLGRTVVGDVTSSPFVQSTTGASFDIRLKEPLPYELDGGDRKQTKKLKVAVKPGAITVSVPEASSS
ncbi:MAG: diacylglycerol/lipid kinase family protein [Actinomycetota bacterium]